METKILQIVNRILANKNLQALAILNESDNLRNDLDFTSFDLAELTVYIEDEFGVDIFEDSLVSTIGEIYIKLA